MKTPRLKPIDLLKCISIERVGGYHGHPDINSKSYYLAKIGRHFYAGQFSKQWYGWNFDGWVGTAGLQLDMPGTNGSDWKALWEIKS